MTPVPVAVWVDPGCPWAWQSAVWLRRLAEAGRVRLGWHLFSLELNASEPGTGFWTACERYGAALAALALARREGGDPAFERLYVATCTRLHDRHEEPTTATYRAAAADVGFDDIVDRALTLPGIAEEIAQEYSDARDLSVFGVPTLRIGDAKVVYGPLIALAPSGDDALELWDHTRWLAERPDFFELKRWPRDIRPGRSDPSVS